MHGAPARSLDETKQTETRDKTMTTCRVKTEKRPRRSAVCPREYFVHRETVLRVETETLRPRAHPCLLIFCEQARLFLF